MASTYIGKEEMEPAGYSVMSFSEERQDWLRRAAVIAELP